MKYKKLKEYLNKLNEDQLNQDVIVVEKTQIDTKIKNTIFDFIKKLTLFYIWLIQIY